MIAVLVFSVVTNGRAEKTGAHDDLDHGADLTIASVGLAINIFVSAIGSAYLLYGKRQYDVPFLVSGFILLIYPYFISNALVLIVIGLVVGAAPFVMARLA